MKKEGTGKPQNPDIALGAGVRMRELHFEKVPDRAQLGVEEQAGEPAGWGPGRRYLSQRRSPVADRH